MEGEGQGDGVGWQKGVRGCGRGGDSGGGGGAARGGTGGGGGKRRVRRSFWCIMQSSKRACIIRLGFKT